MPEPKKEEEDREEGELERYIKLDMGAGVSPEVQRATKKALLPPMDMKKKQLPRAEVTMGDDWDIDRGVEITDSRYGQTAKEVAETEQEATDKGASSSQEMRDKMSEIREQYLTGAQTSLDVWVLRDLLNSPHVTFSPQLEKALQDLARVSRVASRADQTRRGAQDTQEELEELEKERESKPKSRLPKPRY